MNMRSQKRRLSAAIVAPLALSSLAVTFPLPSVAAVQEGNTGTAKSVAADSKYGLVWHEKCDEWVTLSGMECGTLTAPMDYTDPSKGDVSLFVTKVAAKDQDNKLGAIFINPGGPGGGGAQFTSFFARIAGEKAAEQFDFIGIDPRGTAMSTPRFDCGPMHGPDVPFFPLTSADRINTLEANKLFRQACVEQGNEIGKYMTTADLARDIDLARESLGEEKINFFGISYGTHVAATVANMFPEKVRTVAAVSAIDPVQWATGYQFDNVKTPAFQRIASANGAAEEWAAAFEECKKAGIEKCAAANTIDEDWKLLHDKGRHFTFTIDGRPMRYDDVTFALMSNGYIPGGVLQGLDLIHVAANQLRDEKSAPEVERSAAQLVSASRRNVGLGVPVDVLAKFAPHVPLVTERNNRSGNLGAGKAIAWYSQSMLGVLCSDTMNPFDETQAFSAQERNRRILPGEGEGRTWQGGACMNWPLKGQNAYFGPFDKKTAAPMLIVQNEFDGATPYKLGALKLQQMSPGARMILTKGGYGHAPYLDGKCSKPYLEEYFTTGKVPAEDVVCTPDRGLFDYR